MHITSRTEEIRKILELMTRVSTKHITLPVLQCVVITVDEKEIMWKATNLEISIESVCAGTITEIGAVAVPAQTLLQTISLHTGQTVTLRTEGDTLLVEGSGSSTKIKTIPTDDFPTIARLTTNEQEIQSELWSIGLKSVAFAASQSSIKPELGSVLVTQKKEHTLTFVATDSFRLMEKTIAQKNVILDEPLLIPYKNALELTRMFEQLGENPTLRVTDSQCAFTWKSGVYVSSRLTSGSFPDYQQIIPKEYITHTTVLKQDLVHALKKANIFINKFFQVSLTVSSTSLTVSATSGEVGATTETITATTEGEDLTLNFNQRYLAEPLALINDDSLILHFAGIGRPLVIEPAHEVTTKYLVMPMNK